jgi:Coenzyme PQQ synthesis protein D (PqqD)
VATIESGQRFSVPTHVLSRSVGEDTVLLDLHQDEYFSLSQVGSRVWALITAGAAFEAIVEQIAGSYEVERAVVEADVRALIADLLATGLLAEA